MLRVKAQAESLQTRGLQRSNAIGSAHVMAELQEQRGDPAHAAAGHAEQMNAMTLLRQAFLEISFGRRGHEFCVYLSIVCTTRSAAFFGASPAQFADIRSSRAGSFIISRILRA